MKGSVLVDGFVRGAWIPAASGEVTAMVVTPFEKALPTPDAQRVEEESLRLLGFLAPGARHEVRFAPVKA